MLLSAVVLSSIAVVLARKVLHILEKRNYWTLCLRLSLTYDYFLISFYSLLLCSLLVVCWSLPLGTERQQDSSRHVICSVLPICWNFPQAIRRHQLLWQVVASILACCISGFYSWDLLNSREYRKLRWQAWSGPSRTGIPAAFACYIGNREDWNVLESSLGTRQSHPVEAYVKYAFPFRIGVASDPTDLLKARAAENGNPWITKSGKKQDVYLPTESGQSVSLLWGEFSGFRARCSRGIIAVPRGLLKVWPRLGQEVNSRAICLAHGILARNRGLEPASLVCNLEKKLSFRIFEENSAFWPRPSKTLRGLYREEFTRAFSLLGDSYVSAATELALLLADVPAPLIEDWLQGRMEHQDLELNQKAADSGASLEDLARLYRGHYAAMLVSLSLHRRGLRLRPELLVYDALCASEGVEKPAWACEPWAIQSKAEELTQCGSCVRSLVDAIV